MKLTRIGTLAEGEWFHCPELDIEGQIIRQGAGSTVVRYYKPNVVYDTERVFTEYFKKPLAVASSWEVHPGRKEPS